MNDDLPREARVAAMEAFLKAVSPSEAARFVVSLLEAVDGLTRNNNAFATAYKELLEKKHVG